MVIMGGDERSERPAKMTDPKRAEYRKHMELSQENSVFHITNPLFATCSTFCPLSVIHNMSESCGKSTINCCHKTAYPQSTGVVVWKGC
jgi:hypothetical protein